MVIYLVGVSIGVQKHGGVLRLLLFQCVYYTRLPTAGIHAIPLDRIGIRRLI